MENGNGGRPGRSCARRDTDRLRTIFTTLIPSCAPNRNSECAYFMFRVIGCIFEQHDLRLVVLAGVLCLFACATAMSMIRRARGSAQRARYAWLAGAGVVAGSGIWGTHFVAMLAYQSGFPVAYDL